MIGTIEFASDSGIDPSGFIPWSGGDLLTGDILTTLTNTLIRFGSDEAWYGTLVGTDGEATSYVYANEGGDNIAYVRAFASTSGVSAIDMVTGGGANQRTFSVRQNDSFLVSGAPIDYFADYSADYNDRSLVDKEYVDTQLGTIYIPLTGTVDLLGDILSSQDATLYRFGKDNAYVGSISDSTTSTVTILSNQTGQDICGLEMTAENGGVNSANLYAGASGSFLRAIIVTSSEDFQIVGAQANYDDDYSSGYTDRSLIDKGFYDFNKPIADTVNSSTVTGVTTEQLAKSILIPAGTYAPGNIMEVLVRAWKTGLAGTGSVRIYTNTSASLSGATLLGTVTTGAGTLISGLRNLTIKSATNTSILTATFNSATDVATTNTGTPATLNIDWTVARYILVSLQNASAADSIYVGMVRITKY